MTKARVLQPAAEARDLRPRARRRLLDRADGNIFLGLRLRRSFFMFSSGFPRWPGRGFILERLNFQVRRRGAASRKLAGGRADIYLLSLLRFLGAPLLRLLFRLFGGLPELRFAPRAQSFTARPQPGCRTRDPAGEALHAEFRDQVHANDCGRGRRHERSSQVETVDQIPRSEKTEHAACVNSALVERQRQKGETRADARAQQRSAGQLCPAGLNRLGTKPFPSERQGQNGEEEGDQAERLKKQIRGIRPRIADQIQRTANRGGVPRGILGVIRHEGQQRHQTERRQQNPRDFVQPFRPRWR